ncbi:Gfo/Idh/MocA family protein [Bacillus horti]|uniref:Dehydrogenase n=1 Tax=Caldalkalibacillus horti TaxID=77523 RepID=A0ABT9VXA6_9BACI|nr:Gfo/Idh/MocA family oxidoreductase [Bacillus horti]MDQ0165625.1 putative dehydrogenase [Bacillus horti]
MEKLRMGLIGVGGIALDRHLPAYQALKDRVAVTALCDLILPRVQTIARDYSIPNAVMNYEELFPYVDAVTISTPNKFHAEMAIASLKAGKHVLCEKPMAMTTNECLDMLRAAKESGKTLSIAYHYRHTKEAIAAKRLISSGEIGKALVIRVQALRRRKVPGWGVFTNKELQGGGSLIDFGCHFLDLALWLMDFPQITEVSGATYNELSRQENQVNQWGAFDHQSFEVDDHATAYIRFSNGATLLFETSWAANIAEDKEQVSISGTEGGLDVFPLTLYQAKDGMLLDNSVKWIQGEESPGIAQATNFIDSCLGLAEPVVKPEEALMVSQVIEAIYESSQSGQTIRLSDNKPGSAQPNA